MDQSVIPVMNIKKYCKTFDTWANACMTALPSDNESTTAWRKEFRIHYEWMRRAIVKSNLLFRMLYAEEPLRTTPCPVHKGRWSGCKLVEKPEDACACMSGNNITGWIP